MSGAIPPLLQYAFMAWCSVKAQGQIYLYLYRIQESMNKLLCYIATDDVSGEGEKTYYRKDEPLAYIKIALTSKISSCKGIIRRSRGLCVWVCVCVDLRFRCFP
jgi:hypothetical protein